MCVRMASSAVAPADSTAAAMLVNYFGFRDYRCSVPCFLLISIIPQKLAASASTISTGTASPVFTVPLEDEVPLELSLVALSLVEVEEVASLFEG